MKTRKLYEHEILTTIYKSFKVARQNTKKNAFELLCYISFHFNF